MNKIGRAVQPIKVTPIALPQIDWNTFVRSSNDILGRSPTRSLDSSGLPVGDYFSFIASLAEFQHASSEPWEAVKSATRILRALQFVFLVEGPDELASLIRRDTDLSIIVPDDANGVFIVTGNLLEYRDACVSCATTQKPFQLRYFANCLFLLLGKANVGQIFKKWSKQSNIDGTFSLV